MQSKNLPAKKLSEVIYASVDVTLENSFNWRDDTIWTYVGMGDHLGSF